MWWTIILTAIVFGLALLMTLILSEHVTQSSFGDQTVAMVFVQWRPARSSTTIDNWSTLLSRAEIARLEALRLGGRLTVVGESTKGEGPLSRAVIIMQRQVVKPIKLPLPGSQDRTYFYIQEKNGWQIIPHIKGSVAGTGLWVEPDVGDGNYTVIAVESSSAKQGGGGFTWSTRG